MQRLVLDSLRHWVTAFGVDGFRFDLAVTLGRDDDGFDPTHPLLAAIAEDPVLAGTKLIAEPWDVGPAATSVGGFPAPFAEWNGGYRDAVRDIWRGDRARRPTWRAALARLVRHVRRRPRPARQRQLRHLPRRLHAARPGRRTTKSTTRRTASGNRDGDSHNRSWNSGVEGPTDDPAHLRGRRRRAAAMLATLLLSQGVPMMLAGDERGRTQGGNNNAYCHDTPRTWLHWDDDWLSDAVTR